MDDKRAPVMAGFGGAALIAALMSVGGSSPPADSAAHTAKSVVAQASSSTRVELTSNQEGPWFAFCQEYATTEFDTGKDPAQEIGIQGHRLPEEADEGSVEITRKIVGPHHVPEVEKFSVRKHTVGNLSTCVTPKTKLRVAIAFVPDPNETQMRLDFDRDIDAIEAAGAGEGYNYTRFWFPWRLSDWVPDKDADPEAEIRRREEPGILCFRDKDGSDRLFILLVGETPTSGVNRHQFAHALFYANQLTNAQLASKPKRPPPLAAQLVKPSRPSPAQNEPNSDISTIAIAGPHFSASFKGIRDVLLHEKDNPGDDAGIHLKDGKPRISLVSPDASGYDYIKQFREFCSANAACTLQTLSLSSRDVQSTAISYLVQLGYSPTRIAELSEDESAFGESDFTLSDKPEKDYQLKLHFPRDLSSVRSLSDQASAKLAESGSKYFSLPGGSLPVQLTAREPMNRDAPPAFGAEQEATQVARSLADDVEEMRRHRIRAVVVSATNPLDGLYLLEYLHNELPNIRVATVDADTLELDRPHFVDLTGTIAITALPTLPALVNVIEATSQKITPPMSFKSSRQMGEFLAIELLLDPAANKEPTRHPGPCYSVSVVGEGGFRLLPLENLSSDATEPTFPCCITSQLANTTGSKPPPPLLQTFPLSPAAYMRLEPRSKAPTSLLAFMSLVILFNLAHLCSVAAPRQLAGEVLSYRLPSLSVLDPERLYLLCAINNQVFLLNLLATWLGRAAPHAIAPTGAQDRWLAGLFWPLALFTVASACFSLVYLLPSFVYRVCKTKITGHGWSLIIQICIAFVYLGNTAWMIVWLPALQTGNGVYLERVMRIGDGISPVIPIAAILLGYFCWGSVQLKRLGLAKSCRTALELPSNINTPVYERVKRLETSLGFLLPEGKKFHILSVIAILITTGSLLKGLRGFDGVWFRLWFLFWGVGMLLYLVAITCFHAWYIWNQLRELLDWLEPTPMSEAFQRLGNRGLLQVRMWDSTTPQRLLLIWRRTMKSLERISAWNGQKLRRPIRYLNQLLEKHGDFNQFPEERTRFLNRALNAAIGEAFPRMHKENPSDRAQELQTYFALRVTCLIHYAILQINALIRFVACGYVLAVLSVMFYAFEGRKVIGSLVTWTFVGLLVGVGVIMVQFQRNGMISRLEGTAPGKVSYGQLAFHLLAVGGLPLLAIVTSQFPAVANFAFSLFRPVLGSLH